MKKILLLLMLLSSFVLAEEKNDENLSNLNKNSKEFLEKTKTLKELDKKLKLIDLDVNYNIWFITYQNYLEYKDLEHNLELLITEKNEDFVEENTNSSEIEKSLVKLSEQLGLLQGNQKSPFTSLLIAPEIQKDIKIDNPIAVISGFSYIKQLKSEQKEYLERLESLNLLLAKLYEKDLLLKEVYNITYQSFILGEIDKNKKLINEFKAVQQIVSTTYSVYEKTVSQQITSVQNDIFKQFKRALNIAISIMLILIFSFIIKLVVKRYVEDNQKVYTANKIINFTNILLILMILLFAYIENVSYLVTILGFASAGIAIAMKDMFMSILGWFVIMASGTFHVGDRIKTKDTDKEAFVGDIIDISPLRMTIFEDISYNTYKYNRRAGRIIFIPNNYIFTKLIANYTHNGMKTVWDGIDFYISFDSNHKKAMYIIKNVAKKYSKGYTDMAKKQMNKLRNQYSIKNPNVEPRIYIFYEAFGMNVSVWYMANAYAALALRSTISAEIIEELNKEEDIKIAYPTQTIYTNSIRKLPREEKNSTIEEL